MCKLKQCHLGEPLFGNHSFETYTTLPITPSVFKVVQHVHEQEHVQCMCVVEYVIHVSIHCTSLYVHAWVCCVALIALLFV